MEYYKDNTIVSTDTITVEDIVLSAYPDTIAINRLLINNNDKYEGYRISNTNPEQVPDVVNSGTTIKVYYVKRSNLTLTINHYLTNSNGENPILKESEKINNLTFNDSITQILKQLLFQQAIM